MYPIGSIYISINNVNPSTFWGGTWVSFGSGKTLVGVNPSDTDFDTVEKTGGEKAHTLTINEMPSHSHSLFVDMSGTWQSNGNSANYGGGSNKSGLYCAEQGNFTASLQDTYNSPKYGTVNFIGFKGNSTEHNNIQPYITCYFWKRTA